MDAENGDRERKVRAARNQSLYREVNERVRIINEAFDELLPLGDWVCECANEDCSERLSLTHEEYEIVRADGARFAVAPDEAHVVPDVESVVERHERYWIVEKAGTAAKLAQRVDPRVSS